MKILVVDDEQDICEILQYNLETEGYDVETANSAEEALTLPPDQFSLVLLDVMMGEMSGFQMARKMKDNPLTSNIPIIFITALDKEDDVVKGLNIGADDYVAKPLSLKEVKARVKAVLRRSSQVPHTSESSQNNIIQHENLLIDTASKTASINGESIALTKIEFEVLTLLLGNIGKVFSRDELLKRCWPSNTIVLNRTVDVNITRLRKKIGIYGPCLKTRFGYGYTFEKS